MDNVETPRFKHDCSNCKFLGQHDQYDLYVCANLALIIKITS